MALTELAVKKLGKKSRRYEVLDGGGLYVRVAPSGLKTWVFRYQFDGRPRRMTIGKWPGVGVASAREKYSQALQDVQNGIDPGRKAQEAKAALKAAPTFSDLLDEHWEIELKHKKSGLQTKKLIEKNAMPTWGNWKVADIKRRHIVILLDKIAQRAPITRNRVHGALSRLFNFAAERGVIDDSPCTRIKKLPEKGRDRVLTDDEIRLLWTALDLENKDFDIYKPTKLAIKLILLTGQRPGEVCGMRWSEIVDDVWIIPPERRKTADENKIPILPMAKEVLNQAGIFSADSEYVFQSSYKPEKSMTRHALTRAIARHWSEMEIDEKFTPHDLRRTLRTRLAELKVDDIVGEKILGHRLQGVLGTYNRHEYMDEKRGGLLKWEAKISAIVGDGQKNNVIQFARKGV
ncbi:integrase [Desulfosarcina alkanivorans]|uniref:Integrase n=1 Tax=Desulfosarcina alkanivorans TaxID=571177 RepID=A0A5K7YY68_9BACT|nr:site-specific integrase [Desulfosarcina alkanivorans]BBO72071.1 integrase [Desulfosarcina alkanivorans]